MSLRRKGDFKLNKAVAAFKLGKSNLPVLIANESKNHFVKAFRQDGGQTDKGVWKPRKVDPKGGRRGILIGRKGGRLWKSIKITSRTFSKIEIASVGIIYAKRHNEGLDGMEQREFLGKSRELDSKNKKLIVRQLKKLFK